MNRANMFRTPAIAGLALLSAVCSDAADTRHITLTEAVHLAISQNRVLTIARLRLPDLFVPVLAKRTEREVVGVSVPEGPVDEYGHTPPGECDIGLTGQTAEIAAVSS